MKERLATPDAEREGLRPFVDRWATAGPALEEQRHHALQELDDDVARRMTLDLFQLWRHSDVDERGAGMVEARQVFAKLARLEAGAGKRP